GADVFIVQPTCVNGALSVDQNLVELLIMIDAFKRSSAARITAVLPYYGYARQDRKDKPRVPISAKLVANVLSAAGTNRVLTMDLHKAQIQGFFDIPVDHLFAAPVIVDYLSRLDYPNLTLVAPDAGGAERARAYAKRLDAELAVIDKRRSDDGTAEVMNVIGDVGGRTWRSGKRPAVLYGATGDGSKREATPIAVEPKALLKILHSESGANTLISLKLAGAGDTRVLVKEYQLDPVTHHVLHADFYRVAMDRVIEVTIPVVVKGEPKGVKQQGGILEFVR